MSDTVRSMPQAPSCWLTIIGCGEDGLSGLSEASKKALAEADCIFGAPRHLALCQVEAKGHPFPIPFSLAPLLARRGLPTVLLASGDPFWHGAGGSVAAELAPEEWICHPAPSTLSLAAARLGWRLHDVVSLGLHAAPFARLRPHLANGQKLIMTIRDGAAARELAAYLSTLGFGGSRMSLLHALGGPREMLSHLSAEDLAGLQAGDIPSHPLMIGLTCIGEGLPQVSGLPDELFQSDGQMTKRPVRALTLSALAPRPFEVLWDIGAGSGTISVEWLLAAKGTRVHAIEARADRIANIRANAEAFGVADRLSLIAAHAPEGLADLPHPDAVFIGGGLNQALFDAAHACAPSGTRLVANAVTLESEALLIALAARYGGDLMKIDLAESAPLGRMRSWSQSRPVVQWSVRL